MNVRLLTVSSPGARKAPSAVVERNKSRDLPKGEMPRGPQHVLEVSKAPSCRETRCEIMSTYGSKEQESGDAKPLPQANDTVAPTMAEENSYSTITTDGGIWTTRPNLEPTSKTSCVERDVRRRDEGTGIRDLLRPETAKVSLEGTSPIEQKGGRRSLRSSASEGRQETSNAKPRTSVTQSTRTWPLAERMESGFFRSPNRNTNTFRTTKRTLTDKVQLSSQRLTDVEIYKQAYLAIRSNQGAMTPGIDSETIDGMSLKRLEAIANEMAN